MSTHAQDLLATARRLGEQDEPYALVSVLRVLPPAAARAGDKAIVTRAGFVDGWIGGGCAQPAVLRTVQQALDDGQARLLRVAPDGELKPLDDVLQFGMSCPSGGTLELFVDPVLPRARLTVIGDSPVAQALAGLAPRVGFAVSVVAQGAEASAWPDAQQVLAADCPHATPGKIGPGSFVVVATQGRRDVQGLRCALALGGRGVWLVASARKAGVLKQSLLAAGSDAEAVSAIVAPAGTPIGACTPEEVALSVLAAVVAARRQARAAPAASAADVASQTVAVPAPAPERPVATVSSCCGGA
ncbi:XdhC family protein [Aquabacterium sp. OR-4]|uniref:XdhC family protein n=1 Tax=Aquabacterium sp. OR-4 TaxID=2978127 RepID=UPI0021B1CA9C|nr:XdhC family protein [Aquabacterium sp. OR-4]MDT7835733.1 XdhC family protein [Aquabacterium sp. OR-4]